MHSELERKSDDQNQNKQKQSTPEQFVHETLMQSLNNESHSNHI